MFLYKHQFRVRYADTDKMGFMYYGNYSRYYEEARVEALRSLGIRYRDYEDKGIVMPVLENFSKYIKPARYDELLTIHLSINELPTLRVRFDYEIFNESEDKIHIGHTRLVFLDLAKNDVIQMPEEFLNVLSPYFNEK